MLDKFIYNCFSKLDDAVSFVETRIIKMTEWCWHTRVKLLKNKRRIKHFNKRGSAALFCLSIALWQEMENLLEIKFWLNRETWY